MKTMNKVVGFCCLVLFGVLFVVFGLYAPYP